MQYLCNTYAIFKLYIIQDIDVKIEIAINSKAYMSKFFLELSLLSLSLESLNVALKGTLIRFVGKYEHFKQNIAIFIISIDQLLDGLLKSRINESIKNIFMNTIVPIA
jgi:hypothetical protein